MEEKKKLNEPKMNLEHIFVSGPKFIPKLVKIAHPRKKLKKKMPNDNLSTDPPSIFLESIKKYHP